VASLEGIRKKFLKIVNTKEIRDKIWFTLLIIILFRLMAAIPVPGVPLDSLKQFFGDSEFGEVMSLVSGGVLQNTTIVAIGLGPYINASVIFQLLGSLIPKIEELRKEGEQGRRILNMYTRLLAIPLAVLQSFVIYSLLQRYGIIDKLATLDLINMIVTLTAGAAIMMWMGELVSEMGIGGGSSLIIFVGILAGIPGSLTTNIGSMSTQDIAILVTGVILVVLLVVFITEAERQIPIQFARRVRGGGSAVKSHIPLKLNQSGVMPVIFAMSLLSFPQLIGRFLTGDKIPEFIRTSSDWIVEQLQNPYIYNGSLFTLIVLFSLFYTFVVFNPQEIAENLQKQAAFIPGIRPGRKTVAYLTTSAARLAIAGSLFLAFIAILPSVAQELGLISSSIISGTGILILVNTILTMRREVESMVVTRSYESYL
jgi:preprotein translocase subunit SecY